MFKRNSSEYGSEGYILINLPENNLLSSQKEDSVKFVMTTKTALQLIAFLSFPGRKVGLPWDIRKVWYDIFPGERMPTDNFHNIPAEQSISYEEVRERLLNAAISYLAEKIDK